MDKEIEKKFEDLADRLFKLEKEVEILKDNKEIITSSESRNHDVTDIAINVPEEIVDQITGLDERVRFPILWYYSSKQIMTVEEFLNACSDKGFSLSSSWLPSAGGNFKNRLVREDKMFREAEKIGKNKAWTLTDIGRLKIKRELQNIKSKNVNQNGK